MSLFESYDNSEEVIKPGDAAVDKTKLPEIAILTFKQSLMDEIAKDANYEKCGFIEIGETIPIYKTRYNSKDIVVTRFLVGGPAASGIIEELAARGVKKFIIFGSCGTLTKEIPAGCFILPSEAYRDEGTSYHYLPVSDFIQVDTVDNLAQIFDKINLDYVKTKTWTTDAMYRETIDNVEKRKKQGCLVVEMECASIMAVSKVRGLETYQFLYSDDTLDSEKWDARTLLDDRTDFVKVCLEIALKITEEI